MWADLSEAGDTEALHFAGSSLLGEADLLPLTEVNYSMHEESIMTSPLGSCLARHS